MIINHRVKAINFAIDAIAYDSVVVFRILLQFCRFIIKEVAKMNRFILVMDQNTASRQPVEWSHGIDRAYGYRNQGLAS